MSVRIPAQAAEEGRARMLELFPEGFEEDERDGTLELAAYTDPAGEERLRRVFRNAVAAAVAEGWEHRWREFHRSVRAGPLWIGPPWEQPPAGVPAVVIDPGLAFGTGAHPTTRLCVELMAELPRGALLDLGCGSGVLAIAAARLGFEPVTAVDIDPQAVDATRRNAAANGVEISARRDDVLTARLPRAGLVVANLTLAAVESLGGRVRSGLAVTSGYLVGDRPKLSGFRHQERRQREGWAADTWEHSE